MNIIQGELDAIYIALLTNEMIGLEILLSTVLVGIFLYISFFGLKHQKIKDIFSVHYPEKITNKKDFIKNCWDAPILSSNGIAMWRVYFSLPLALLTMYFYKTTVFSSLLLLCYVFLFASDMLDGAVARKLGNVTGLGKILDPLADKCLDLPILLIVCWHSENIVFVGFAIAITVIDILGQSIRGKTSNPAANIVGKIKTVLKVISIYLISFNRFDIFLDYTGIILLSVSLLFTFSSFFLKVKNM